MVGSSSIAAKIVRIEIEEGTAGLFYATSKDLPGLLVAKSTMDAVRDAIPAAITEMFAACSVNVVVAPVQPDDICYDDAFVAVPMAFVKASCDLVGAA